MYDPDHAQFTLEITPNNTLKIQSENNKCEDQVLIKFVRAHRLQVRVSETEHLADQNQQKRTKYYWGVNELLIPI